MHLTAGFELMRWIHTRVAHAIYKVQRSLGDLEIYWQLLEVTGMDAGVVFKCMTAQVSRLGITNGFAYHSEIHAATISRSSWKFHLSVEF